MMTLLQYEAAMIARAKVLQSESTKEAIVISRWAGTQETPEWTAWVRYWRAVGAKATLEIIEGRTSWTVPTLMPEFFDVGYNG